MQVDYGPTPAILSSYDSLNGLIGKYRLKTDFEEYLEEFFVIFEDISFEEEKKFLEKLIGYSDLNEINFLWTILQPVSHRDYFYGGKTEYPGYNFKKLSTPITRRFRRPNRERSILLKVKDDVDKINQEYNSNSDFKLAPIINQENIESEKIKKLSVRFKDDQLKFPAISHQKDEFGSDSALKMKVALQNAKNQINLKKTEEPQSSGYVFRKQFLKNYAWKWNEFLRNIFLRQLVLFIDPRQQYFMLGHLMIRKYKDFLGLLPDKISIKILSYLSLKDIKSAEQVSRAWSRLCKSDSLWKSKCVKLINDISYYEIKSHLTDWRKLFQRADCLKYNWSSPKYEMIEFKGHRRNVLCLTIERNVLATGSLDRNVMIWSLDTGSHKQTLRGHTKGVWSLIFITKYLLCSGSFDCTIKIWNLKDSTCSRTLYSHTGPIWAFCKHDHYFVSASQDKTAKVWDFGNCELVFTLKSHKEAVFCCDMFGTYIVTGSADRSIKLWSKTTGGCLRTLYLEEGTSIISISMDKDYIACSTNQKIHIIKFSRNNVGYSLKKIQEYKEHFKRIECLKIRVTDSANGEALVASGSQDGYIKYWNIKKPHSTHTFDVHNKRRVNCVYFDEFRIASAASDNTIKILNFDIIADDDDDDNY